MTEPISVIVNNPTVAHMAIDQGWKLAKAHTLAGRWVEIVVREADDIGTRQRNFYHGYVLLTIANTAVVAGRKHDLATWKEYFRSTFLGWRFKSYSVPGRNRKARRRERISTEDIGVRAYSQLIDKVLAYGATELGIEWEYQSREDWESHGQQRRAA